MHCPEIKTFFNIRFGKLAPKPKKSIFLVFYGIFLPPSQLENVLYPYHSYYSLRIIFFFLFEIFPLRINFPPSKKFFSFATIDQTRGRVGSMELSATSTWLIFEIRRWREERVLVRKGNIQEGNMCKIIRNCSRRCRLNPISPVSISSHRAGYSPFRRITLPSPLITPSNLYPLPLCSTCAHLLNNTPADYRPRLYLAVRANHRRLTAALWIFPLVNRLLAARFTLFPRRNRDWYRCFGRLLLIQRIHCDWENCSCEFPRVNRCGHNYSYLGRFIFFFMDVCM